LSLTSRSGSITGNGDTEVKNLPDLAREGARGAMRGTFLPGDDVASAAPPVLEDFVVQGGAITLDSVAGYPYIKWGDSL
jgi:hypothetical protein